MPGRIIVALVAGWLVAACAPPAPDIDVDAAHDLGVVVKGDLAAADIPVRNLGRGPLAVYAVSTSCGCTTATLSSMTIPPAGEARLHVEYDSGLHDADLGFLERFVFISSDDPDEDDVRIKLTVFVKARAVPPGGRPDAT